MGNVVRRSLTMGIWKGTSAYLWKRTYFFAIIITKVLNNTAYPLKKANRLGKLNNGQYHLF